MLAQIYRLGWAVALLGCTSLVMGGCSVDERSFDSGGSDAGDILGNLPNPKLNSGRRGIFNPVAPTTLNQLRGGTLIGMADHNGDGRTDFFTWDSGISPAWVPAGASLNVTPVVLVPFSGSTAPAGVVF